MTAAPDLEAMAPPGLSIMCFRYAPEAIAADAARLDAVDKTLLGRIQLSGKAFLSGTVLRRAFMLRACPIDYQTRRADLGEVSWYAGVKEETTCERKYSQVCGALRNS